MRKHFLLLFLTIAASSTTQAQTRGVKIGYIDMEYILQNVPDYTEAKNQLEQKAQQWKQEVEVKKNEIVKLKDALKTEQVLLTKELIDERQEEIKFLETELLDYQQKRFGSNGDLIIQKAVLIKPIQDQVFTAVQDISEAQKYDFIFDKSSDLTMLFAAKRFDISDRVIRAITRAEKREQLTKKQLKAEEAKEYKENLEDANPALAERQKILDDKKAAREKLMADRKAAAEEKKKAAEDRRKKLIAEKEAKKNGTVPANDNKEVDKANDNKATDDAKQKTADAKAKTLEDRKKAIEDRKKKILEDREAAKKAKEDKLKENKTE
ncbi:OmpH family outer membrane protein [Flavobacterium sp.]|uniref:OmpH family outer membrane protein n=1 Tax=Flavobacterium sp. TaxID=239 RepID=UPI002B4B50A9|nr:OmpH family outer membrane protein [Flavobacterium sp.]HLF52793.1 OmpH family outer membrane protein [Flavobacterium sp.]